MLRLNSGFSPSGVTPVALAATAAKVDDEVEAQVGAKAEVGAEEEADADADAEALTTSPLEHDALEVTGRAD